MHTDEFEHLTHREWREILRWRAWDAEIALDQAVEARRKAVAKYRAGEAGTLEEWTDLRQALGTESKTRQKYHNALEDYNSSSATTVPASAACESSPRDGSRSIRAPVQIHRVIRRSCRH
jgi:hypothetical protein